MVRVLTYLWPTDMHNVGFGVGFLLAIVFLMGVFVSFFWVFLGKFGHVYDFSEFNI